MPLSKKAARALLETIEEYAQAKADEHWMLDQGHGPAVTSAVKECAEARIALLIELGLEKP